MRTMFRSAVAAAVLVMALFSMPAFAVAATAANQPGQGPVLTGIPLVDVLLGMATPLVGYLLNHFAPWTSEQAKGLVQFVLAAVVAAVAQAVGSGNFGLNQQTLVAILTAVVAAVGAHYGYRAGGLNVALGAGDNHDGTPSTSVRLVRPRGRRA